MGWMGWAGLDGLGWAGWAGLGWLVGWMDELVGWAGMTVKKNRKKAKIKEIKTQKQTRCW